jgi:hypothetical protein
MLLDTHCGCDRQLGTFCMLLPLLVVVKPSMCLLLLL